MHERPHRTPLADDREAALEDHLQLLAARLEACSGTVEAAIAQHDAAAVEDGALEVLDRLDRCPHLRRRRRVERVVLALDGTAHTRVRVAGVALCHEPLDTGGARRGQEVVGAFGAQPVRQLEALLEAAEVDAGQRGQLMDDRVRLRLRHGGHHRVAVERVEHDRLGAQIPDQARLCLTACGADDLMAVLLELRDEAAADRASCSCKEDLHHVSFPCFVSTQRRGSRDGRDRHT